MGGAHPPATAPDSCSALILPLGHVYLEMPPTPDKPITVGAHEPDSIDNRRAILRDSHSRSLIRTTRPSLRWAARNSSTSAGVTANSSRRTFYQRITERIVGITRKARPTGPDQTRKGCHPAQPPSRPQTGPRCPKSPSIGRSMLVPHVAGRAAGARLGDPLGRGAPLRRGPSSVTRWNQDRSSALAPVQAAEPPAEARRRTASAATCAVSNPRTSTRSADDTASTRASSSAKRSSGTSPA